MKNNKEIVVEHLSDVLQAKVTIPNTNNQQINDMISYTIKGLLYELNDELDVIKDGNPNVISMIAKTHKNNILNRGY